MSNEILGRPADEDERFRIHVPSPDTELVLGRGSNDFVGIMGRVDRGGIFFGAGGFPLSIPSADSSYAGFKRAHTTIAVGIGGIAGLSQFIKSFYLGRDSCFFDAAVNGAAFGVGTLPGAGDAAAHGGTPEAPGNVSLYGDGTVALASPMTVSATAGLSASLNGSVASVNGVVAASVNAVVASVNGIKAATVSGFSANLIGMDEVVVASRAGTTAIEGSIVEIGKPSGTVAGRAYRKLMTGGQDATESVVIRADDLVQIEPGKATDKVQGAPTKLQVTPWTVRAETKKSALMLEEEVRLHSGSAVLHMGPNGLKLFHAAAPIKDAVDGVVKPAEKAWWEAYEAADAIEKSLHSKTLLSLGTALGAGAVAIPAALGGAETTDDEVGQAAAVGGLAAAGTLVGAVLGGLATVGVTTLVERKLAGRARKAAKKAADAVYANAVKGAMAAEKAAVKAQGKLPANPTIDITADAIVLSVGTSKLTLKASGIELETAPGAEVKINGQPFAMGMANNLAVKS